MRVIHSIAQRYLEKYYENKNTIFSAVYFFRLYHWCKVNDSIFFSKPYDREEVKKHNLMVRNYLQKKLNDEDYDLDMMNMLIYIETQNKLDYCYDFFKRFETYLSTIDFDAVFNPLKWSKGMVAVEEMD